MVKIVVTFDLGCIRVSCSRVRKTLVLIVNTSTTAMGTSIVVSHFNSTIMATLRSATLLMTTRRYRRTAAATPLKKATLPQSATTTEAQRASNVQNIRSAMANVYHCESPRRLSYTRLLAKIEGKAAIAGRYW